MPPTDITYYCTCSENLKVFVFSMLVSHAILRKKKFSVAEDLGVSLQNHAREFSRNCVSTWGEGVHPFCWVVSNPLALLAKRDCAENAPIVIPCLLLV